MSKIFAAELSAKADLLGLDKELLLQIDVPESASCLVASSGERIIILYAGELDCQQVLLSRSAADHESDMVRRAGRGTKGTHLLNEERKEGSFVLDGGLSHRVEICLVG